MGAFSFTKRIMARLIPRRDANLGQVFPPVPQVSQKRRNLGHPGRFLIEWGHKFIC